MKTMPNDRMAEASYIASCMVGGAEAYYSAPLSPVDFYSLTYRRIMGGIVSLVTANDAIDLTTIAAKLDQVGVLERVGVATLSGLLDIIPTSANIKSYAEIIKAHAQRREIITALTSAVKRFENESEIEIGEALSTLESKISFIKKEKGVRPGRVDESHIYAVDDMINAYQEHIKNLRQNTLKTGIINIDNTIRGVAPGEVLTIIARAGSFKTALLQHILKAHSEKEEGIAVFFSLEMPVPMVFERFQQSTNAYQGRQVERLYSTMDTEIPNTLIREKLKNLVIIPVKVSLQDMQRYIPLVERKMSKRVSVIGIDYLGLVDCKGDAEYQRNSDIARGVKDLAKDVNLPIVLLSQTSRKGGSGDVEITLDSGRGSGAIEEGADFVLGMWQREVNEETELVCAVLKNRKGKKGGKYVLEIFPEYMRFGENSRVYLEQKTAVYE